MFCPIGQSILIVMKTVRWALTKTDQYPPSGLVPQLLHAMIGWREVVGGATWFVGTVGAKLRAVGQSVGMSVGQSVGRLVLGGLILEANLRSQ